MLTFWIWKHDVQQLLFLLLLCQKSWLFLSLFKKKLIKNSNFLFNFCVINFYGLKDSSNSSAQVFYFLSPFLYYLKKSILCAVSSGMQPNSYQSSIGTYKLSYLLVIQLALLGNFLLLGLPKWLPHWNASTCKDANVKAHHHFCFSLNLITLLLPEKNPT